MESCFCIKVYALIWCTGAIQIRTFYFIKRNGLCAIFVVERNDDFIVIQVDRVNKGIDQHFAVRLLPHVQFAETVKPERHKLRVNFRTDEVFAGNPDFQILFAGFLFFKAGFRRGS